MSKKINSAPRPGSLRTLIAWFFALSFGDYKDELRFEAHLNKDGDSVADLEQSPFAQRLRQVLWWPPDIFALTSSALSRTGAYRMVVGPDGVLGKDLWQRLDWQPRVEAHAEAWRSTVSSLLLEPIPTDKIKDKKNPQPDADRILRDKLRERIRDRCQRRRLERQDITSLEAASKSREASQTVAENLIEVFVRDLCELRDEDGPLADQNLLAVSVKADRHGRVDAGESECKAARFFEAIIGLHILSDAASDSIGMPRGATQEASVFDAIANVMLTLRGSLSTVPKFHGVVLPKMRTPQAGLTLRSLSHHLTFHDSEVEVMWRSFPWANLDENTLNVLFVPYPFDFNHKQFKSNTHQYESVGYFTYDPGDWGEIDCVVDLIAKIREDGISPHMLVFSETAFNEATYETLLRSLSKKYGPLDPGIMPVVVAGVAKEEDGRSYNELRLATYFAGKWYELSQQKHHRWQLTQSQIRQYGLQGHLSTARPLFEQSVVGQRRLTFFAPTPWLVLSPLICEDLSRIEPVSELIRGVGPTLVLALLLDGPQLAHRWPVRYASVLADDPGSAVLTVTSYGAANASRPNPQMSVGASASATHTTGEDGKAVVASWKDPSAIFQTLSVKWGESLLMTITASIGEQFTLDRRGLTGKAASFRLDGVKTFATFPAKQENDSSSCTVSPPSDDKLNLGKWSDIREVTAVTYVASAALTLLRPHQSQHPTESLARTDQWDGKALRWKRRCQRVRQLIDVMLGRPVLLDDEGWENLTKKEAEAIKEVGGSEYSRYNDLRAERNALLNHIFKASDRQASAAGCAPHKLTPNRHIFAVLGFSQSTIDVEVRDENVVWPTPDLRFGGTVLRILLDTIAGIDYSEDNPDAWESNVYQRRLRIAGRANRSQTTLWDSTMAAEGARDVLGASAPLYNDQEGVSNDIQVNYLAQFQHLHQPGNDEPLKPERDHPNRYDFYRMVLELVDAILKDTENSLWKRCRNIFKGAVGDQEMHRLALLVLMMLPALIHEQLEFEQIRLNRNSEIALGSGIMHRLMTRSEDILKLAAKRAHDLR